MAAPLLKIVWPFVRRFWKLFAIVGLTTGLITQTNCHNSKVEDMHKEYAKEMALIELKLVVATENSEEFAKAKDALQESLLVLVSELNSVKEKATLLQFEASSIRHAAAVENIKLNKQLIELKISINQEVQEISRCESYVPAAVLLLRRTLKEN